MFNVKDHAILLVISGSRSYGIHTPESDVDVKGICIPPIRDYRLGIVDSFEQADSAEHLATFLELLTDEEKKIVIKDSEDKNCIHIAPDGTIYDIAKFFKLALNANPNILEVLFCDDEDIRLITPEGERVRENRNIFLSKKVVWSYQGYAFSQMKRIKNHRAWLLNPPTKEPTREDFGLPPAKSLLSGDEQNAFLWLLAEVLKDKVSEFRLSRSTREELQDKVDLFGAIQSDIPDHAWPTVQKVTGATTEFIQVMQAERKYKSSINHWNSYQNWKRTRNIKRAKLEEKCRFDSKHGSHLARLMLQGCDILEKGILRVRLPKEQREWLMHIRNGDMRFKELEKWFNKEQEKMKILAKESSLPEKPDRKKANEILTEIQAERMEK